MKLYCDLDNFLNDHSYAWCRYANEKGDHNLTVQDMRDWNFMRDTIGGRAFGFFQPKTYRERIAPLPGSVEFLREIEGRYGPSNVLILTTTSDRLVESKNEHIVRDFSIPIDRVIHSREKSLFSTDGILIDDSPANVIDHILENGQPGVLFNYNGEFGWSNFHEIDADQLDAARGLLSIVSSYDELLSLLDELVIEEMVA